jgi:beta-barrel assembly-enhancing protease
MLKENAWMTTVRVDQLNISNNMLTSIQNVWKRRAAMLAVFATLALNSAINAGCSGANLFSKADDIALGRQVAAEIAANPQQYPVLNNTTIRNYVQNIVNQIVASPNVENKDFEYYVTIINDDNTVNAFAIPGGRIYVYTGLLKFVDNEATLAGILAHEIAHSDSRHATEQLTKVYGLQTIAGIALGGNPGVLAEIAASLAGNLAVLKFSRDAERESDREAFESLASIPGQPWHPGAMRYFMIKSLNQQQSQPSRFENLFASHPPSQERLNNIDAMTVEYGLAAPSESNLRSMAYSQMITTLNMATSGSSR